VTANGWDSDATAGTPTGNEPADPGSTIPGAWDPEAWDSGTGQSASGPSPSELIPRLQVPGMAAWSPARDYMVSDHRRRMRRRTAGAAAAILAIGVVAAVATVASHNGGQNGSPQLTATQIVQQATRQQNGLHSESAAFSEHLSGQVTETVTGTVELQRKPLLMAMDTNLTGDSQAMTMRAILTDNAMYLKLGNMAGLPRYLAAKWIKIPLTGLGPSSLFASLQQEVQNENPASQLAGLAAAEHLRADGTQIVNGVTTTRYNGSFAPSAALKALPAAQRSALGEYMKLIKGDVSFSVWIDSSHYVRKVQESDSTGDVSIAIECTYGSFNEPVKIALPRPRQIYSPSASALND
jgi:hypothetical protein